MTAAETFVSICVCTIWCFTNKQHINAYTHFKNLSNPVVISGQKHRALVIGQGWDGCHFRPVDFILR